MRKLKNRIDGDIRKEARNKLASLFSNNGEFRIWCRLHTQIPWALQKIVQDEIGGVGYDKR